MTAFELIERLSYIVQEQADIIRIQAAALEQVGAIAELDERLTAVEKMREEIGE